MNIQSLVEAKQVGSAFLVTGAFNPYTLGHEEVAKRAATHAHEQGYSHFYHGLGASENAPDAPLSFSQKEQIVKGSHAHIKAAMPKTKMKFGIIPQKASTSPFHQIVDLIERGGHKHITVALGPDQMTGENPLSRQIEKHMATHGGILGSDKKTVHKVKIDFHPLAQKRDETDRSAGQLRKLISNGRLPVEHAKAGRIRKFVMSGDTDVAHAMMPESIHAKKGGPEAYAAMIRKQFTDVVPAAEEARRVERNKKARERKAVKKKITEHFSTDKINEFMQILSEAQIVRGTIEERKARRQKIMSDMKRKNAENMLALIMQQQAQRKAVGSSPELRDQHKMVRDQTRMGFVGNMKNALTNLGINFARKIMKAKVKEVQLGLDKPARTVGSPQKPRRGTMNEEVLNEASKRGSASPSKTIKKVRTETRAAARGGSPKIKDKIRKQEDRREAKKSSGYAVIMRKEGGRNKIKIVKKEDIGSGKVIIKPQEFTKAKARQYLKEPDFEITDSSKALFPEFRREKGKGKVKGAKKQEDKKAKKKKKQTVTDKEPRDVVPTLPQTPKGGRERTTPKSQYPDFDHTSLNLEAAIPVLLNQMMGVAVDPSLMSKIGAKIKTSKTLGPSAQRAAQAIVDQYGEVVSVHMGAAKTTITPLWKESGGTDTTPKTDILLVPKDVWKAAKGDVSKIDMRKAIRCSMKVGDARIINAESGEAAATVQAALTMAGDIASKNKKVKSIIKEIKDAMLSFAKSAELGQFTVDDIRDMVASKEEPDDPNFRKYVKLINEQDKLKDFVADKFREVFDVSKEFRTAILRESFTGVAKFGEKSAACATHVLAMSKDGSNLAIEEISDEFIDKILPDLKIRGAFKGRSWEGKNEKGKKVKFRGFSTLFNIDYKRKIHEQIEQSVETIEPTSSMTYPNATQIVKNELDQIGDNFELLMQYSELEPSMITSNALDLTEYANVPARAYNTITIDNNRVVTIPVHDFERFEQQQQETELMNEDPYEFINDFIVEHGDNQEAIEFMLSSGLVGPESIQQIITQFDMEFPLSAKAHLLNEMWETSMLRPEVYDAFFSEARNYKKEYREYHGTPEQRANRSKRVLARRKMAKKGKVRKGDGKDVHHRDGNPQNNEDGNLGVLPKSKNRAMHEEHGAGEIGTDALRKKFMKDTPNAIDPLNVIKGVVKNGIKHK